jgi:hypothetical protein
MSNRTSLDAPSGTSKNAEQAAGLSGSAKVKLWLACVVIVASVGWVIWSSNQAPEKFQVASETLKLKESLVEVLKDPDFRAVDVIYGASGESVRLVGGVPSSAAMERLKKKVAEIPGAKAEFDLAVVRP